DAGAVRRRVEVPRPGRPQPGGADPGRREAAGAAELPRPDAGKDPLPAVGAQQGGRQPLGRRREQPRPARPFLAIREGRGVTPRGVAANTHRTPHTSGPPPMRILHTADWHLNDKLGWVDRTDDLRIRVEQVADLCRRERADALVIAGDLFYERAGRE